MAKQGDQDPTTQRFQNIEVYLPGETMPSGEAIPERKQDAMYSERFTGKCGPWDETLDPSELAERLRLLAKGLEDGTVRSVCISYVSDGHWLNEENGIEVNIAPK
jgi:hypothetical protein